MADSDTSYVSEACNSKGQCVAKRPSDAFSIEKLLSSEMCLTYSTRAAQQCGEEEPCGRNSAVTSIASADSSSVGLPSEYCEEEEEDEEVLLEEDMEDQSPAGATSADVVSTTLADHSSNSADQRGE